MGGASSAGGLMCGHVDEHLGASRVTVVGV
jgi:hypothetical protein